MSTHTVTIDAETTHLSPRRGLMWELALIVEGHPHPLRHDGEWVFTWPAVPLAKADPDALRIGRFYERTHMLRNDRNMFERGEVHVWRDEAYWQRFIPAVSPDGKRVSDFGEGRPIPEEEFQRFVAEGTWTTQHYAAAHIAGLLAGAVVVGCRPEFDLPFIDRYLRPYGQQLAHDYHTIDVAQVTLGRLPRAALATHKYRSDDLAARLEVQPPTPQERHTALGDARWARRWLARLEETAGDAPW